MGRWIFPALPLTRSAAIFLLPVRRMTIVYQRIASAVGTMNRDRYHLTFRLSHISSSYSLTSFLFWPLPKQLSCLCTIKLSFLSVKIIKLSFPGRSVGYWPLAVMHSPSYLMN